jgi:hypothetical protein
LILVASPLSSARQAVQAASEAFLPAWHGYPAMYRAGMYCCGACSVALWRHIAAGGLPKESGRLARGLQSLRAHRTEDGRWRRFPDFYTLLALTEIDLPAARRELRYAVPRCERYLKRRPTADRYAQRRRRVAERVLALT